jgi:hypothetical protein
VFERLKWFCRVNQCMKNGRIFVWHDSNVMPVEQYCQFLVFLKCEMWKMGKKCKKLTFWTLDDQYLDQKVSVVGVQHFRAYRSCFEGILVVMWYQRSIHFLRQLDFELNLIGIWSSRSMCFSMKLLILLNFF